MWNSGYNILNDHPHSETIMGSGADNELVEGPGMGHHGA
jgi:hypothetical protein